MQAALGLLLGCSGNVVLMPGLSPVAHLRENLAAAETDSSNDAVVEIDTAGSRKVPTQPHRAASSR